MKPHATLVFDIGKTTKKALVFNERFSVLEEVTECFPETADVDGFPCENLPLVCEWMKENIRSFSSRDAYKITHINFSAYGASMVAIDQQNHIVLPFQNYLKPCPENTKTNFLNAYDDGQLLRETASPWLGFLNSGIQAYWMKYHHPEFGRVQKLLHLPQFFSFLVTGKFFNERTSLGCHTLLWDFGNDRYHEWVVREGLDKLFPSIYRTSHTIDHNMNGSLTKVGVGIHDSSAALMPYLVTRKDPFLMLSTGTWNICFNPWNHDPLTTEELGKDCLCYLTYDGKPVKASRIFLGHEHEVQQKALSRFFNTDAAFYQTIQFDERLYLGLKSGPSGKFFPMEMDGTGPIPGKQTQKTDYSAFGSFEEAQHQLMIDLVSWQRLSIDLVDPHQRIRDVILVGGFSKSALFLEILKREIPGRRFYLSDHPRASALGAAWLVHDKDTVKDSGHVLNITAM